MCYQTFVVNVCPNISTEGVTQKGGWIKCNSMDDEYSKLLVNAL